MHQSSGEHISIFLTIICLCRPYPSHYLNPCFRASSKSTNSLLPHFCSGRQPRRITLSLHASHTALAPALVSSKELQVVSQHSLGQTRASGHNLTLGSRQLSANLGLCACQTEKGGLSSESSLSPSSVSCRARYSHLCYGVFISRSCEMSLHTKLLLSDN